MGRVAASGTIRQDAHIVFWDSLLRSRRGRPAACRKLGEGIVSVRPIALLTAVVESPSHGGRHDGQSAASTQGPRVATAVLASGGAAGCRCGPFVRAGGTGSRGGLTAGGQGGFPRQRGMQQRSRGPPATCARPPHCRPGTFGRGDSGRILSRVSCPIRFAPRGPDVIIHERKRGVHAGLQVGLGATASCPPRC